MVDGGKVRREVIASGRLRGRGQRTKADIADYVLTDRSRAGDESSWRAILGYFAPAVKLGLTATPQRRLLC